MSPILPGERTCSGAGLPEEAYTPGRAASRLAFLQLQSAYAFYGSYCEGKRVLDVGCGYGAGSLRLSSNSDSVVGVDVEWSVLTQARRRYKAPNLCFCLIPNHGGLPFQSGSFDVVVANQVIEHVHPSLVSDWLAEVCRILEPDGVFLVATCNRALRLLPFQKPWNRYHYVEYSWQSFERLLRGHFEKVEMWGLDAKDPIYKHELERVRQRPVNAYVVRPIRRFARAAVFGFLGDRRFSKVQAVYHELRQRSGPVGGSALQLTREGHSRLEMLAERASIADFWFTRNPTREPLDLLSVCRKQLR